MFCIFHVPTKTYLYGAATRQQIENELIACKQSEAGDPMEYRIFEIPGDPLDGQMPGLSVAGLASYIDDPKEIRRQAAKRSYNARMRALGFTEAELLA